MKNFFKDKVAIITGSSNGIGKAVAWALAENGAKIVLNGRNEDKLQETYQTFINAGHLCLAVAGDISDFNFCRELVEATMEKFGQIDILINNAGISAEGKIADTEPDVFQKSFAVNVLGVIYPTKAALPFLKNSKGHIIITGSIAGFMGLPEYSAYSSTKMALTALSQSLRIELAGTGVHVGLNYVGFVVIETKTFLNKDGKVEAMEVRAKFKRMPREKVAAIFLRGIERRKKTQVLSPLGKVTSLLSRWFPGVFEKIMTHRYRKNNS